MTQGTKVQLCKSVTALIIRPSRLQKYVPRSRLWLSSRNCFSNVVVRQMVKATLTTGVRELKLPENSLVCSANCSTKPQTWIYNGSPAGDFLRDLTTWKKDTVFCKIPRCLASKRIQHRYKKRKKKKEKRIPFCTIASKVKSTQLGNFAHTGFKLLRPLSLCKTLSYLDLCRLILYVDLHRFDYFQFSLSVFILCSSKLLDFIKHIDFTVIQLFITEPNQYPDCSHAADKLLWKEQRPPNTLALTLSSFTL